MGSLGGKSMISLSLTILSTPIKEIKDGHISLTA